MSKPDRTIQEALSEMIQAIEEWCKQDGVIKRVN